MGILDMDGLEQQFRDFVNLVEGVLMTGVAGFDFGRILIALGILFFFLIVRGLFTRFVLVALQRITAKTKS